MSDPQSIFLTARGDRLWPLLQAFLTQHADPVTDCLAYADVLSGLGLLSQVWLGVKPGVGDVLNAADCCSVAFSFPLNPTFPALGIKGRSPADERAMLLALRDAGAWQRGYVICKPEQVEIWAGGGQAACGHHEIQMVSRPAEMVLPTPHGAIREASLDELDRFYRRYEAGAWNPAQFQTGPYVVAEVDGEVVSAAGTHFGYPELAQVGNVLTAPAHRGHGWARACTAAVAERLTTRGHGILSLFVAGDNAAARHIYAGLGFKPHQNLATLKWQAPALAPSPV